jgi:hypothetical protein
MTDEPASVKLPDHFARRAVKGPRNKAPKAPKQPTAAAARAWLHRCAVVASRRLNYPLAARRHS